MKLYKYLSPILLFVLVLSTTLTSDSFSPVNYGNSFSNKYSDFDVNRLNELVTWPVSAEVKDEIAKKKLEELAKANYNIAEVAYREVGNIGGEKYWRWYGYNTRPAWCCVFVSWCANQCGYLEKGIIPKFSYVSAGVNFFKDREEWVVAGAKPKAGMIIFFDFVVNDGLVKGHDGKGDHVGIVRGADDEYVYCVEGNYKDTCQSTKYRLDNANILGYGAPNY